VEATVITSDNAYYQSAVRDSRHGSCFAQPPIQQIGIHHERWIQKRAQTEIGSSFMNPPINSQTARPTAPALIAHRNPASPSALFDFLRETGKRAWREQIRSVRQLRIVRESAG